MPENRKPLVFVPGLPGSELDDNKGRRIFPPSLGQLLDATKKKALVNALQAPDDFTTDDGVRSPGVVMHSAKVLGVDVGKQAASLFVFLAGLGYRFDMASPDFNQVPWDWRLPVDHTRTQQALVQAVEDLFESTGQPVVVLVHSTGGLVFRALLAGLSNVARSAFLAKVDHLIALGVPWGGTLKALRYVALGEDFALGLISDEESRSIMERSWAVFDLMPPDPVHTDDVPMLVLDENDKPVSPLFDIRWLAARDPAVVDRAHHSREILGTRDSQLPGAADLPVTNVVGWGRSTDVGARFVAAAGGIGVKIPWQSPEGDGTVPRVSAEWLHGPKVRRYFLPVGLFEGATSAVHSRLWDAWPVQRLLTQVLLDGPRRPFVCAAVDEGDVYQKANPTRIRVVGLDPDGKPLTNARANFGSGSKQGRGYWRLDDVGRAVLPFNRYLGLTSNAYYCPVVVRWDYQGSTHEEKFPLLFFK